MIPGHEDTADGRASPRLELVWRETWEFLRKKIKRTVLLEGRVQRKSPGRPHVCRGPWEAEHGILTVTQ